MSKSPNDKKRGESIKKIWQHDEEAEQEKSRTIYAQQLKELGLGSGNESTPLNQDTSLGIERSEGGTPLNDNVKGTLFI